MSLGYTLLTRTFFSYFVLLPADGEGEGSISPLAPVFEGYL